MELKEIREVYRISESLGIDFKQFLREITKESEDFEVDNFRFISEFEAEELLYSSYLYDEYLLGCFNAWFISNEMDIDIDIVEELQKNEQFVTLGKIMLKDEDKVKDMLTEAARLDGWGHMLGSYDGSNEEITLNGITYIYFQI